MSAQRLLVLYICLDSSLGGSTASLYNLIESVKDDVHPIVLFPEIGLGYSFFQKSGIECYIYPFIKLYKFKKNRLIDVFCHPWRWHYVQKWRNDRKCIRFINKVLNGRKVNIVHSNTSPNDIGVSLSRAFHCKHIWHVREYVDDHFHFNIYRGIPRLRKLINQADARIAISSAIMHHWGMRKENTWIINDAVRKRMDACYFPDKDSYVLFSSYNLTEEKGTRNAIEAFAMSGVAQRSFRLVLMGNCKDEYRVSLMKTASEYGVESYVDFIPCQTDVKSWFAHAAAFLMASRYEGLGRVTAEAMFFGCPVIAHASGGTLDLVKDGETGYLFNTLEECAALLRKVCEGDNELMVLRAQEFASSFLSQEAYGPKIMNVYNKTID